MRVRLTRKLAESVDGIDLSAHGVGDILDIHPADAQLLIAEDWAVREDVDAADRADDASRSKRRRRKRTVES
jgi:hypothetical protein